MVWSNIYGPLQDDSSPIQHLTNKTHNIKVRTKFSILNSYDGIFEEDIRKMSHEELIEAVLRAFKVREIRAEDYHGGALLPDELADAFRNRQ